MSKSKIIPDVKPGKLLESENPLLQSRNALVDFLDQLVAENLTETEKLNDRLETDSIYIKADRDPSGGVLHQSRCNSALGKLDSLLEKQNVRIGLVGATKSGKSAVGNFLAGQKIFTSRSGDSTTAIITKVLFRQGVENATYEMHKVSTKDLLTAKLDKLRSKSNDTQDPRQTAKENSLQNDLALNSAPDSVSFGSLSVKFDSPIILDSRKTIEEQLKPILTTPDKFPQGYWWIDSVQITIPSKAGMEFDLVDIPGSGSEYEEQTALGLDWVDQIDVLAWVATMDATGGSGSPALIVAFRKRLPGENASGRIAFIATHGDRQHLEKNEQSEANRLFSDCIVPFARHSNIEQKEIVEWMAMVHGAVIDEAISNKTTSRKVINDEYNFFTKNEYKDLWTVFGNSNSQVKPLIEDWLEFGGANRLNEIVRNCNDYAREALKNEAQSCLRTAVNGVDTLVGSLLDGLDTASRQARELAHKQVKDLAESWEKKSETAREFWKAQQDSLLSALNSSKDSISSAFSHDPSIALKVAEKLIQEQLNKNDLVHNAEFTAVADVRLFSFFNKQVVNYGTIVEQIFQDLKSARTDSVIQSFKTELPGDGIPDKFEVFWNLVLRKAWYVFRRVADSVTLKLLHCLKKLECDLALLDSGNLNDAEKQRRKLGLNQIRDRLNKIKLP